MTETNREFTMVPPDLSKAKGPMAWIAKKIQNVFGAAPKPGVKVTKPWTGTPKEPKDK